MFINKFLESCNYILNHANCRYGFHGNPKLWLSARPTLGERQVNFYHISNWIEQKLCQEFQVCSLLIFGARWQCSGLWAVASGLSKHTYVLSLYNPPVLWWICAYALVAIWYWAAGPWATPSRCFELRSWPALGWRDPLADDLQWSTCLHLDFEDNLA